MTASYQTISLHLRYWARQLEPFAWSVSLLTFFAIGVLDDIPFRFPYIFFWRIFLGPMVTLVRWTPGLAFLSTIIGVIITPVDSDRYHHIPILFKDH